MWSTGRLLPLPSEGLCLITGTGAKNSLSLSEWSAWLPVVSCSFSQHGHPVGGLPPTLASPCHPSAVRLMLVPLVFQELSRQQRTFQALDQECAQMKARLTQELQQAKNTHNILQADLDKVGSWLISLLNLSPFSLFMHFLHCC